MQEKLNYIWKELHDLPKYLKAVKTAVHEAQEKSAIDATKNNERLIKAVTKAAEDNKVTEVAVTNQPTTESLEKTVKDSLDKTLKVEITNHQKQDKIEFPKAPETIKLNSKQLNELKDAMNIVNKIAVESPEIVMPSEMKVSTSKDQADYVPVRLTDGEKFINVEGLLKDIFTAAQSGASFDLPTVESTDNPGVFGLVVLNPDGSTISAGTTTPTDPDDAVDNIETQNGDDLLLQDGSFLLVQ